MKCVDDEVYHVCVLAYCLMPNHYHLVLKQNRGGSVSRLIQTTCKAYTQALNKGVHRCGTLFQGRMKGEHLHSGRLAVRGRIQAICRAKSTFRRFVIFGRGTG